MAFITKKHLSRRTFLTGAGVTIALPFLESMVPAATPLQQTAAKARTRFGAIYFPHGATMDKWTPAGDGANFELSEILQPLQPYRDRIKNKNQTRERLNTRKKVINNRITMKFSYK